MFGTGSLRGLRKAVLAGLAGALLPAALAAQEKTTVPPGTPVTITVQQAPAATPGVSITLGPRHGHVTPIRHGCTHTGGGNNNRSVDKAPERASATCPIRGNGV